MVGTRASKRSFTDYLRKGALEHVDACLEAEFGSVSGFLALEKDQQVEYLEACFRRAGDAKEGMIGQSPPWHWPSKAWAYKIEVCLHVGNSGPRGYRCWFGITGVAGGKRAAWAHGCL